MKHIPFYNHLNEYVSINEIEYEKIIGYFEYKSFKKKDLLLEIDNKNINMFFIIKGCLHMYFITEKGIKKTVQIAIENWWLTDLISFRKNFKSEFNIQAIEKSEVYP